MGRLAREGAIAYHGRPFRSWGERDLGRRPTPKGAPMANFLKLSYCDGYQPEGIATSRHVSRADLIARMLRERNVARFVIAPAGYGRSTLACEYASIVFSFKHVFWVRCTSPCFLRDLDAGTFLHDVLAVDPQAALVVWEDVPRLSAERSDAFADLLDGLLEHGVEVLVTSTPTADTFSELQRDRLQLNALDIMLSPEEMHAEAQGGRLRQDWESALAASERTPCVRWGEGGTDTLLAGLAREEMPAERRLATLLVLCLGEGHLEDLSAFLPAERAEEASAFLAERYPFLGIDRRAGLFRAMEVTAEQLGSAYGRLVDGCVEPSMQATRDDLCERIADALLGRGSTARAMDLMAVLATKRAGAHWLARNGWKVLCEGDALGLVRLYRHVQRGAGGVNDELSALVAWASLMLDDVPSALGRARRLTAGGTAPLRCRIVGALVGLRLGLSEGRRPMAEVLRAKLQAADEGPVAANEAMALAEDGIDWRCLGALALRLEAEPSSVLGAWAAERDRLASASAKEALRNALLLASAWAIDDEAAIAAAPGLGASCPGEAVGALVLPVRPAGLDDVARFVRDCLEQEHRKGSLGWCAAMAGSALERLAASQPRFAAYLPAPCASSMLHKAEVALFEQRDALRRLDEARQERSQEYRATHPDAFRAPSALADGAQPASPLGVPLLRVQLFGGLQVHVGDALVRPQELSRHKTRLLLALLVLGRGREVSRHRLAETLWPASSAKMAVKNFYSVWSQLRRALSLGDSCPYLIRTQDGCRLDDRLVTSDIEDFEKMCRTLLFGTGDNEDWERLYMMVCDRYSEDLLPCDDECDMVNSLRQRYHIELVDALIAASKRLGAQGEPRGSLWFAREAVRRDGRREDAYIALMESQILSDQRTDALETYFSCRRFLSEELGIDPSLRLVELYRSVIETEQVMA